MDSNKFHQTTPAITIPPSLQVGMWEYVTWIYDTGVINIMKQVQQ